MKPSNELDKTKQLFEPIYGRHLTNQEIFSIEQNLLGFFRLLIKLDRETKKESRNEPNN
jgi:hypothetical protein